MSYQFPYPYMGMPMQPSPMTMMPQTQQVPTQPARQSPTGDGFLAQGVPLVDSYQEVVNTFVPAGVRMLFANRHTDELYLKETDQSGVSKDPIPIAYSIKTQTPATTQADTSQYVTKQELEQFMEEWSKQHEQPCQQPQPAQSQQPSQPAPTAAQPATAGPIAVAQAGNGDDA